MATAHDAAKVIVTPDVEEDVFATEITHLSADHPPIGLQSTVPTHAEVADRFTEVSGEVLLPGLMITHLVTLGETVAVGVETAGPIPIDDGPSGAIQP